MIKLNKIQKIIFLILAILIGNTMFASIVNVPSWIVYNNEEYYSREDRFVNWGAFNKCGYRIIYISYKNGNNLLFEITSRFEWLVYMKTNLYILFHWNIDIFDNSF